MAYNSDVGSRHKAQQGNKMHEMQLQLDIMGVHMGDEQDKVQERYEVLAQRHGRTIRESQT